MLWYIVFACSIQLFVDITSKTLGLLLAEKTIICNCVCKSIAILLCTFQFCYIIKAGTIYNDIPRILRLKFGVSEIRESVGYVENRENDYISWKEFFAENLFTSIKEKLNYGNEKVAAFGFHPSVLMYNGFNCIDGYNSVYPLAYYKKFRSLIAPELARNKRARNYYDSWGGRLYLYTTPMSFTWPSRKKEVQPMPIFIDSDVFFNDFKATYILSRCEISNAADKNLELVEKFVDDGSIYNIWVYGKRRQN